LIHFAISSQLQRIN